MDELLLLVFLLTYPFDAVISFGGTSVQHEGLTLTRLIAVLLFGVFVARGIWNKDSTIFTVPFSNPVAILIICYIGVMALSGISAHTFSGPLSAMIQRLGLFLSYYLIVGIIRDRRNLRACVIAFVLASVPSTMAGLYEMVSGEPVFEEIQVTEEVKQIGLYAESSGTVRVRGLSPDPLRHAAQLLLQLGLLLAVALNAVSGKEKLAWGLLALLIVANIAASGARSVWLGLAVMISLFFLLAPLLHKRLMILAGGVGVAIAFVVLMFAFPHLAIRDRLVLDNETSGFRPGLARATVEMVRENPLLGVGAGNFQEELPRYLWAAPSLRSAGMPRSHNVYLSALADTGFIGLLALVAMHVALLLQLVVCWRRAPNRELSILGIGLLSAFVGFWILMQFNALWDDKFFWALMGLSGALANVIAVAGQGVEAAESRTG